MDNKYFIVFLNLFTYIHEINFVDINNNSLVNCGSYSLDELFGKDEEKSATYYVYPGMKMKLYARHKSGFNGVGDDGSACAVTIDGVKKINMGTYTYTIPNNVSQLTLNLSKTSVLIWSSITSSLTIG